MVRSDILKLTVAARLEDPAEQTFHNEVVPSHGIVLRQFVQIARSRISQQGTQN